MSNFRPGLATSDRWRRELVVGGLEPVRSGLVPSAVKWRLVVDLAADLNHLGGASSHDRPLSASVRVPFPDELSHSYRSFAVIAVPGTPLRFFQEPASGHQPAG